MASDQQNINSSNKQESAHDTGVRKLCAIMFTDIKDFSGRMQRDEVGTMRMLGIHNRMMSDAVQRFGGVVIKTVGDAFLVTFDSVVSATQCAISVQQAFIEYNAQIRVDDEKITVRIGVHLGDVIVKDNDVFGDGVNIASRIQSMAEVGGVNISESVYQQVRDKLNINVLNLGVPQLKGIETPIKVFQVIIVPTDKARGKFATNLYVFKTILKRKKTKRVIGLTFVSLLVIAAGVWYFLGPAPPANSLAVLPFEYNGDVGKEYLADGFTDDILSSLSRMTQIKVLSSGSTIRYKNTKKLEDDIARELNVRYLLRGRLVLEGEKLTIRFRLVDPFEQRDVLNKDYDNKYKRDLAQVRSEILRQVVSIFESKFSGEYAAKPEAYEHFLSGLEYDRKERKEDNQLAIAELNQAIEKDANFVPAYIKLASNQLLNHERGYDLSEQWLHEAEKNINKVLAIDKENPEAYLLLGRLNIERGDRKKGVEYLEQAIAMEPDLMRAYVTLAQEYMINQNDPPKAITVLTKAYELEPTNYNISVNLAIGYAMVKKYDESVEAFRRASTQNPEHELPWINLAYLYEILGKKDSALVAYENALRLNPSNPITAEYLSILFINGQKYDRAESTLTACLKFEPSNYSLQYTLGVTKMFKGLKGDAKRVWEEGRKLAEDNTKQNPNVSEHYYYLALFSARLGMKNDAITSAQTAVRIDSSENNVMGMARVYSLLGNKTELIAWFSRARSMNPEYDEAFITQDIDLQPYRNDKDLVLAAKK